MKKLTGIEKKAEDGEDLTLEELRFLYEIDEKIEGFGYSRDPRIDKIKRTIPLSKSLKKFSEKEQKDFVLDVFKSNEVWEQILKDKEEISYLLVLMKENVNIKKSLLKPFWIR